MEQQPHDQGELTENAIRLAYAERLEAVYRALQHQNMTAALQAGSRAIIYCVQAGAWDRLGGLASGVVTSTSDPRLLEALIPHLQTAAESAPEGERRWSCLCYLADALKTSDRPEMSVPFYERAATQARAAAETRGEGSRQVWAHVAAITGNWANAVRAVGNLDVARQRHLESAQAEKKAGRPAIHVVGSELEALRIDIMQGNVAVALPQVEARLAQAETWWRRRRSGERVPDAPDAESLARVLLSALNIATEADFAQEDWGSALRRLDSTLEIMRALQRSEVAVAGSRINRANVLGRMGRFGEAKAELEECIQLFQNNPVNRASALSSLASLLDWEGDVAQAITQERRALALREQLPDPAERAISHNNLARHLRPLGTPSSLAEALSHQLAALVYLLVARMGQNLQASLRNYAMDFECARATGTKLVVPRVAELLADPAFHPLEEWLHQRQVNMDELQAALDQSLEQARQAALRQK
jgi:tetratricopeptide (TPR) repeat protein